MNSDSTDVADAWWGHVASAEHTTDLFRNADGSWCIVTRGSGGEKRATVSDAKAVEWLVRNNFNFPDELTANAVAVAEQLRESDAGQLQSQLFFREAEFEREYSSLGPGDDGWKSGPYRSVGIFGNVVAESLKYWKEKIRRACVRANRFIGPDIPDNSEPFNDTTESCRRGIDIQLRELWESDSIEMMLETNLCPDDMEAPDFVADAWQAASLDPAIFDVVNGDFYKWLETGEFRPSGLYVGHPVTTELSGIRDRIAAYLREFPSRKDAIFYCDPIEVESDLEKTLTADRSNAWDRFDSAAIAARLLTHGDQRGNVAAYVFYVSPGHKFIGLLREAYLAGLRRWITRALKYPMDCHDAGDARGFLAVAKLVLTHVREAYSHECRFSLLGYDDLDILRLAYPLLEDKPAANNVDCEALSRSWFASPEERLACCESGGWDCFRQTELTKPAFTAPFIEFVDSHRVGHQSLWGNVLERCGNAYPSPVDPDFECRSVAQLVVDAAVTIGRQFGVSLPYDAPAITDEVISLTIVEWLIGRCVHAPSKSPESDPKSEKVTEDFEFDSGIGTDGETEHEQPGPHQLQTTYEPDGVGWHSENDQPPEHFYKDEWLTENRTNLGRILVPNYNGQRPDIALKNHLRAFSKFIFS